MCTTIWELKEEARIMAQDEEAKREFAENMG